MGANGHTYVASSITIGASKRAKSGYTNIRPMHGRVDYYEAEFRYRGKRYYVGAGSDPIALNAMILNECIRLRIPYKLV